MLCKGVQALSAIVYFISLYALSRGFAHYSLYGHWAYTTLLIFRFPGLCTLRQKKEDHAFKNYNSELIIKAAILFILTQLLQ